MSKKTRNKEKTTQTIENTFFAHVLEKGYNKVNINQVATDAKVSIGTLYHHFPKGKVDIILKFFEESKDLTMDVEDLKKFDPSNIPGVFEKFIAANLKNQRDHMGYCIAMKQAILSDKGVHMAFQEKVSKICTELVDILQKTTSVFKTVPRTRLIQRFELIFNLIESLVHHHLFVMNLFPTDGEFTHYLLGLIRFTLTPPSANPPQSI